MNPELIFEIALKSLPICLLALLLPRMLAYRSAAERAALLHSAVAVLILLPVLVLYAPPLAVLPAPATEPVQSALVTPHPRTQASYQSPIANVAGRAEPAAQGSLSTTATPAPLPSRRTQAAAALPWLLLVPGALMQMALAVGLIRLQRLRTRSKAIADPAWQQVVNQVRQRMGIQRPVALLCSADVDTPMSFGMLRPTIVLDSHSAKLDPGASRSQALIAHELAHLARHDWLALIASRTLLAIYWFNPLIWLLSRQAHQLREEAADDAVLRLSVGGADYASLLVQAARQRQIPTTMLAHAMASAPGSLKRRVQRALNGHLRRAPAHPLWSVACALTLLALAAPLAALAPGTAATQATQSVQANVSVASDDGGSGVPLQLSWSLSPRDTDSEYSHRLSLKYRSGRSHSHTERPIRLSELTGLAAARLAARGPSDVQFSIIREAGSLSCQGSASANSASGNCEFAPAADYAERLASSGVGRPSVRQQLQLTLQDVRMAVVDELQRQGYERFDVDQLVEMGIHGVSEEWLQDLGAIGYRVDGTDRLVEFRIHRVDAQFISELAQIGPQLRGLPPGELVELQIHGVSAASVRELVAAGYPDLQQRQLVEMAIHGADLEYIQALRSLGYTQLSPRQLVEMRIHRVSPGFIRSLADLGYVQLAARQLVEMRIHRVTPEFIQEQNAEKGRRLSVSRLVEMRIHGA